MQIIRITIKGIILGLCIIILAPHSAHADTNDLEVAGWIPYWRDSEGIKDAKKNIDSIDIVFPFAYTVTTKGGIRDQAGLSDPEWKRFVKTAQGKGVQVIPTIMWNDGASIHNVLSGTTSRAAHVAEIASMVTKGKYDGVDIDYESKNAETIDYFSLFLKELKSALGQKLLTCTVEARTPPESLYKEVPEVITYANDYSEIGKHCDGVEIMAYDQQRADLKLNSTKNGTPYIPVADVDWVRKVVSLAVRDIPRKKILLGIPTYGHHYAVTVAPEWFKGYQKIGALNVPDILEVAKEYKAKPSRNKAGEMSFSYIPKSSSLKLPSSLKIPNNTPSGNIISARALAYANKTGETVTVNVAWYSDAEAMRQKIDLAKEFSLKGVALFKFDGEEDKAVWKFLK